MEWNRIGVVGSGRMAGVGLIGVGCGRVVWCGVRG